MRYSAGLKVASVIAAVVITRFSTTSILAQRASTKTTPAPMVQETGAHGATPNEVNPAARPPKYMFRYHLKGINAKVSGNDVLISSSIDMIDKVGAGSYVWRLTIYPAGGAEPISDHLYDKNVFSIDPSGEMTANFSENLNLLAGRYRASIVLYGVPKGSDLTLLQDEANCRAATTVGGSQVIVVD